MTAALQTETALAFLAGTPPARRRSRRNAETLQLWFRLALVCALFLMGNALWLILPAGLSEVSPRWTLIATVVGTVVGLEVSRRRPAPDDQAAVIAASITAGLSGGAVLLFAGFAWRLALAWAGADAILLLLPLSGLRLAYAHMLASLIKEGRLAKRVAVIGSGPAAQRAVAELERNHPLTLQVSGRYAVDERHVDAEQRGDMRTLLCDSRLDMIDAIVLALEPADVAGYQTWTKALRACVQDVLVVGEAAGSVPGAIPTKLGASDMLMISQQPIRGTSMAAKRVFDVIVACMLLAFMAPLLALLAMAIRLETSGPILFRQLRVGYNHQLFYILKFRSMYWQETDRLAKQQTVRGDKRVTRVGRIIRKLSLDELPQLLNVVHGDMSLVGPRPHAPGTSIGGQRVHTLVEDYPLRHMVCPGITGLAQVRGFRGGLHDRRQVADRISSDLEYIQRWSLWLDVRILFGTVLLELRDSRGS